MSNQSGAGKPTQCRATSKQRKRAGEPEPRCRRFATRGKSLCSSHGSSTEQVPCLANVTHGLTSKYIKIDDVPAITTKIEQAKTVEGRTDLLARNAALLQHRLEQVPVELEHLQLAAGGAEAVRRQLETLDKLNTEAATALPVFVLSSGPAAITTYAGRDADGNAATIYELNGGEPWILSHDGNTLRRCVAQTDLETGAVLHVPVEQHQITDGTDRH
jgi:hypothetical protein